MTVYELRDFIDKSLLLTNSIVATSLDQDYPTPIALNTATVEIGEDGNPVLVLWSTSHADHVPIGRVRSTK